MLLSGSYYLEKFVFIVPWFRRILKLRWDGIEEPESWELRVEITVPITVRNADLDDIMLVLHIWILLILMWTIWTQTSSLGLSHPLKNIIYIIHCAVYRTFNFLKSKVKFMLCSSNLSLKMNIQSCEWSAKLFS
jgi:hypothetical protein